MDPSSRSSGVLLERADTNVAALLRRFENIIALAPDQKDRSLTANESYQMEVETAALIRAAEDLTALTRRLKELWLFGQLNTLGPSDAEGRAAERAREVAASLEQALIAPNQDGDKNSNGEKVDAGSG